VFFFFSQSALNFAPFQRQNLVTTNYALGQSLARHYISGALFRAGWVVGSLDLIGSPAGFTRIVGDGIRDFVGMPFQGIFHGPWAFISGITYGSTSLVKHVSAGRKKAEWNAIKTSFANANEGYRNSDSCQGALQHFGLCLP
jgi:vacuolar protein sorting-associated protein 13B